MISVVSAMLGLLSHWTGSTPQQQQDVVNQPVLAVENPAEHDAQRHGGGHVRQKIDGLEKALELDFLVEQNSQHQRQAHRNRHDEQYVDEGVAKRFLEYAVAEDIGEVINAVRKDRVG